MPVKKKLIDIPEAKIRIAKWMIKEGKTKKATCEFLGITYNTKKLDELLSDFDNKIVRIQELKDKAKLKVFSAEEQKLICKEYVGGKSISGLAEEYYVSSPRIKSILLTNNIPIRARSKHAPAQVAHINISIDREFNKKDIIFVATHNCVGEVLEKIASEDILEFLLTPDSDIEEFECDIAITDPAIREARGRWVKKFIYEIRPNGPKYANGELVFPNRLVKPIDEILAWTKNIDSMLSNYGCTAYNIQRLGEYYRYMGPLPAKDLYPIREDGMVESILKKEKSSKDSADNE